MPINKVVFGQDTLLDLTGDTVSPVSLLAGITAHDAAGNAIIGELAAGASDVKAWSVTVASPLSTSGSVLIDSDSWLAGHYNDADLVVCVVAKSGQTNKGLTFAIAKGENMPISGGYYGAYGYSRSVSGSYSLSVSAQSQNIFSSTTRQGHLHVTSAGGVKFDAGTNVIVTQGDYKIVAWANT